MSALLEGSNPSRPIEDDLHERFKKVDDLGVVGDDLYDIPASRMEL
jgi:hypothetical protein